MKYFSILRPMKKMSDSKMSHGKMSDIALSPLLGLNLVIKLRNFDFESHWNTLIFFDKKDMVSDLNMSDRKMFNFVSFLLFRLTLVINFRSLYFEGH